MKPWGKVSSFPGANTVFEGQQTERRHRDKETHIEERHRRDIKDADQGRSKQQIQRGTRAAPRRNVR
jgi:hypothetical protein